MEKISVIIPMHNSAATINACIMGIINNGYFPLEIIVVDDDSTDDSPRIVEGLRSKYSRIIKLIRSQGNKGPAMARNIGAEKAEGKYLFFLDSDTEAQTGLFDNFIKRMKESDAVVGVYHFEPLNKGIVQEYKALLNHYFFSRKGVIRYEVFDSSRAGIRADVFKELGGFDKNFTWGMDYENEEFGYRLSAKHTNLLDPSIVVKHFFPGFGKLTKNYFNRVSLWAEVFVHRKKFESGGLTSWQTGFASAALLMIFALFPVAAIHPFFRFVCLFLMLAYISGYIGFFRFVLDKKPRFLPLAVLLNAYFTVVIAVGAFYGFIKIVTGTSKVRRPS